MHKIRRLSSKTIIAALLALLVPVLVAGAAEISDSDSIPNQKTNWSQTFTVNKFDPALGELTQVEIVVTGHVSGTASYESLDNAPATISLNLQATIGVTLPNSSILQVLPLASVTDNADAFDFTIDFDGPSGGTFPGLTGTAVNTQTLTLAGDLAPFIGPGTINLPALATGSSTGSGAGNLLTLFNTDAAADVNVKYTYIDTDYGDAPDPGPGTGLGNYNTLAGDFGAVHTIVPGIYLGAGVDAEVDGQPSPAADGDDMDLIFPGASNIPFPPGDEDGVVFTSPLIGGTPATVVVTAALPPGPPVLLQGWIDFNGNGSWADPGEQIFLDIPLAPGPNPLPPFVVPPGSVLGSTFARFRFSTVPGLPPVGPAPDGEVEDYQVSLQASVEVCKEDTDGNKLPGWTINATGQTSQQTGANGCTTFTVGQPGTVTITETLQANWTQISPAGGSFQPNINSSNTFGPFTFVNFGDATIQVCKQDTSGNNLPNWMMNLSTGQSQLTQANGCTTFTVTQPGSVTITETVQAGWTRITPASGSFTQNVSSGGSYGPFTFVNFQDATIQACKEDNNGNKLAGWTMNLSDGQNQTTQAPGGCTTFTVQAPGTYTLTEQLQAGWTQLQPAGGNFVQTIQSGDTAGPFTFINRLNELDFGDAPDPTYPTLLASNGARHTITNLFLGALIDAETDGQPNPTATGDDIAISPDEDGVVFTSPLQAGQSVSVTVTASGPGLLDAWIDFSADGDWTDSGEQIFSSQAVNAGPNNLAFSVPIGAVAGPSFARFRLSTAGGLAPTGAASDGEVEDYQVQLQGAPPPYDITKTLLTIEPVRVNNLAIFSIKITNTGSLTITTLPLTDTFDASYLAVSSADPTPDNSGSGFVSWNDLTGPAPNGFNKDLGPGQSFEIIVRFVTLLDTSGLTQAPCNVTNETCNVATVSGAVGDDGPGGNPPQPLPPNSAHESVEINIPTAVDLADSALLYSGGAVELSWRTVSEANTYGFHILRAMNGGPAERLTNEMIRAAKPGQTEGASYSYEDATVTFGATYRYALESQSIDGGSSQTDLGVVTTGQRIFMPQIVR